MPARALKAFIRRLTPDAPGARPNAPTVHALDGSLLGLYRADGSQSRAQFEQQTLPLFRALHRSAVQRQAVTAEPAMQALLEAITRACQRAANERLPRGGQVTDYRRYETLYNYALISAMAIAWHMDVARLERGGQVAVAENFLPPEGLARLQREALVWAHWQAFFEGGDDGGLRDVAGRSALPGQSETTRAQPVRHTTAKTPPGSHAPVPEANTQGTLFVRPDRSQWAQPLARGWVLVEAIREGLQDGSLPYNRKKAWVQVDREGRTFLQVPEVFEWCHERLNADTPPKTLINQFGRLNICTRTRKGQNLLRGGRRNQKHYQQGFVVEDPALFWGGDPPAEQFYIRHLTRHGFGQPSANPANQAE